MHEYSLVRSLLRQASQAVEDAEGCNVSMLRKINAACGMLSGVEPCLVRSAFETLKNEFGLESAELNLIEEGIQASCTHCRLEFNLPDFTFRCPNCGSPQVRVISGEEFKLLNVQVAVYETDHNSHDRD